jgi:hypothetical protein
MHYLLAYWLISNAQIIATPAPMEFNDKQACEAALQAITDDWQGTNLQFRRVLGRCHAAETPTVTLQPNQVCISPTPAADGSAVFVLCKP